MNWIKKNLFSSWLDSLLTVVIVFTLGWFAYPLFKWLFVDSVFYGDSEACRQSNGACLSFLKEKMRFILFGFYPEGQTLRPIIVIVGFLSFLFYSRKPERFSTQLIWLWVGAVFIFYWILAGGMGLVPVPISEWGGLPLTLVIAFVSLVGSYPLGILLALGRRSQMPTIKAFCVFYIELIRGVPLISLLFMASVMFPLFLPEGVTINKLLRVMVAMVLFASAYMAEVVRGGLASIPKGQYEGAESLGLSYYQVVRFIILPQALKKVIPPTVNVAISMFKDTSLVLIIALFDLLMTAKTSTQDTQWLGFSVEAYLFVALIYFAFCFSMGSYSRRLEKQFYVS